MDLTTQDIIVIFLALGTLLATARLFGEIAMRFHQPAVLGEILAGILLGPTVLGTLAPNFKDFLFPSQGATIIVLKGLTTLAIVLFLLVAGMEVDLSTIWRQGRAAFMVSIAGIVFPFASGFASAWFAPGALGRHAGSDPLIFALFFATALSISALPVIAKTLMDLKLYRSDLGMTVIAAAIFDDLVGWLFFAVILGMMGTASHHDLGIGYTIGLTLGVAAVMLTIGRWVIHRTLPWLQAHTSRPGGVLGFAVSLALFGAALTEWIGIHAVFGAFLVGVALGDSPHLRERTREVIDQFISFIFAPLFFASIGLQVNFVTHFDLPLTLVVLNIACVGKIVGCGLAARWGGLPTREAWALGFAMNSRGAMEIILGLLALQYGIIENRMFVALVVMALATSIMSGPIMQKILKRKKFRQFIDYLKSKLFINPLIANDRNEAIRKLAKVVSLNAAFDADKIEAAVLDRENVMATGIGHGVAVPHARMDGLSDPIVAVGLSNKGIDFDAPDDVPAKVVFFLLTPLHDEGAQLEILADIARTFSDTEAVEQLIQVSTYTEFLAFFKTQSS